MPWVSGEPPGQHVVLAQKFPTVVGGERPVSQGSRVRVGGGDGRDVVGVFAGQGGIGDAKVVLGVPLGVGAQV